MQLINFVNAINETLPTQEEFVKKMGTNEGYDDFIANLSLTCTISDVGYELKNPSDLISFTNSGQRSIGGITFYNEVRLKDGYMEFALLNDFFKLTLNDAKEVHTREDDFESMEMMSPSFELFLKVLIAYAEFNTYVVFGRKADGRDY